MIIRLESIIVANITNRVFEIHMHSIVFNDLITMFIFKSWVEQLHIKFPHVTYRGLYGAAHPNFSNFIDIGMLAVIEPATSVYKTSESENSKNIKFLNYSSNKDMKASHFEPTAAQNVAELFLPCCDNDESVTDRIHSSINEALLNATDWAYDGLSIPQSEQNWWLTGISNEELNRIIILVYDQGASLPYHFSNTRLKEVQQLTIDLGLSDNPSDKSILKAAIEFGKSEYRAYISDGAGRGLRQMRELTADFRVGKFLISSGYGILRHDMLNGVITTLEVREQEYKLPGTLIYWELEA